MLPVKEFLMLDKNLTTPSSPARAGVGFFAIGSYQGLCWCVNARKGDLPTWNLADFRVSSKSLVYV